jgi:predicted phosphodiesterase
MKIAVITDLHANLPALQAVLPAIRAEGCDLLFHTGDAIAIGPYPRECLDLLLNTPAIQFVMGNHDAWFVDGLPRPQPVWMSDGEVLHQHWTHAQLDPAWRATLAGWPYLIRREFEGVPVTFVHYALALTGRDFVSVVRHPTASDLDRLFDGSASDLIFFGHDHASSDLRGRARYVNPGSLGCYTEAVARYCVAEFHAGTFSVAHRGVPYDDAELVRAFEGRAVPEREFINQAFFGGRLSTRKRKDATHSALSARSAVK